MKNKIKELHDCCTKQCMCGDCEMEKECEVLCGGWIVPSLFLLKEFKKIIIEKKLEQL